MPQLFSLLQLLFLDYYLVIVHVTQVIFKNFFPICSKNNFSFTTKTFNKKCKTFSIG